MVDIHYFSGADNVLADALSRQDWRDEETVSQDVTQSGMGGILGTTPTDGEEGEGRRCKSPRRLGTEHIINYSLLEYFVTCT